MLEGRVTRLKTFFRYNRCCFTVFDIFGHLYVLDLGLLAFDNKGGFMLLEHRPSGALVEVLTLEDLYNPCRSQITGQSQSGEEMQDPDTFHKSELIFPSGEPLPRCWCDAHYRENVGVRHAAAIR